MKRCLFLVSFLLCIVCCYPAQFKLIQKSEPVTVLLEQQEDVVVHTAFDLFSGDMENVSGVKPVLAGAAKNNKPSIIIGTIGKSRQITQLVKKKLISTEALSGRWEAFQVQLIEQNGSQQLVVAGSDSRGTAYGILELSRLIGVSPWEWWADVAPEKKTELLLPSGYSTIQQPSVQYRGIFLNDEDWGLMPWSSKTFEPSAQKGQIGPKTYGKIFELLLRLRANTLWPAMHESTIPFYFVAGNKEMADKYGIVVGTSHCEPLMRNGAGEWDTKKMGDYNYLTNKTNVQNYWADRLKEVGKSDNFYTIGMRGVHDGKMEGVKTLDEQTTVLSEVIKDQRLLLQKYVGKDVTKIPQAFIPYKEVLEVYDNGLQLPDDVTLVWCDDNYGYLTRLSNEEEQKRMGGGGIYYHISYWGRPHDYLWLCTTQPALMYWQLRNAWNNNVRKLWILNVGDIKPAEYNIEFFMDMAWNVDDFTAGNAADYLTNLYERDFGKTVSGDVAGIMNEYYRLASIRKPEFMGWSRVEEASVKGGKTPVIDTEFNPYGFGDEIKNRLDAYDAIKEKLKPLAKQLPEEKKDAFFQLIEYPVYASAGMNEKLLYAQKARLYAQYDLPVANEYAAKSREAYNELLKLTTRYNEGISNGKWKGMMDVKPRNLPVFQEANYPNPVEVKPVAKAVVWVENESEALTGNRRNISLPAFVKQADNKSFISILQQGSLPAAWAVINKPDWLIVNEVNTGMQAEKRLVFSVLWNKLQNSVEGDCSLRIGDDTYTFGLKAIAQDEKIPAESNRMIAINAKDYTRADNAKTTVIRELGHNGAAVELAPGEVNSVEYDIYTFSMGRAILSVGLIPNHPVDKDIRYAVAIDDEKPQVVSLKTQFRSETWKINVLRNQSVNNTVHKLTKPGKHTIKIYALDRGIILDRLLLDFENDELRIENEK
ncbi:glycosyl hydrolase 115 family protein [Viscerimonas tarda]